LAVGCLSYNAATPSSTPTSKCAFSTPVTAAPRCAWAQNANTELPNAADPRETKTHAPESIVAQWLTFDRDHDNVADSDRQPPASVPEVHIHSAMSTHVTAPNPTARAPPNEPESRRNSVRDRFRSANTHKPPPVPESQLENSEAETDAGHSERRAPPCARYSRQ
jgi:hypothetical protein